MSRESGMVDAKTKEAEGAKPYPSDIFSSESEALDAPDSEPTPAKASRRTTNAWGAGPPKMEAASTPPRSPAPASAADFPALGGAGQPQESRSVEFVGEAGPGTGKGRTGPPAEAMEVGTGAAEAVEDADWAVRRVIVCSDVYRSCLNHALSTEVEEVMGLLVGWHDEETRIVTVTDSVLLKRSDKQKDRVEIPTEELFTAAEKAGVLSASRQANLASDPGHLEHQMARGNSSSGVPQAFERSLGRDVAVVGWYHSHPHITVFPSHVDVRTQKDYQQMGASFVGLIFSVYNDDAAGGGVLPYIAFQSVEAPLVPVGDDGEFTGGTDEARLIPVNILPRLDGLFPSAGPLPSAQLQALGPRTLEAMAGLLELMTEESRDAFEQTGIAEGVHHLARLHNAHQHSAALLRLVHAHGLPLKEHLEQRRHCLTEAP